MYDIVLIPGDGIGPEVAYAAKRVIDATGVRINWSIELAGEAQIATFNTPLPVRTIDAIRQHGVALKGPITTPKGSGFRSVNVALRKELDLYTNLRPAKNYKGITSRYENVDIVIVRENTEDLYAGVEHMVGDDCAESIKIFTRKGCERIIRYAFEYAKKNNRKRVTAVHKANIMKVTDGMFLSIAKDIATEYPTISFDDRIIDALCMDLVIRPETYDVLVCPNLYGDIVSDLCAGITGGLGVAPGANIGINAAVFEAVHGSAPEIAGKNMANPIAMMLSGVMMLRHLGEGASADALENAILKTVEDGILTSDLMGNATTTEFTEAVEKRI